MWPRPAVTATIPPPPPANILSPAPIVVPPPPPPPPAIAAVYPPTVPYYDYGPYAGLPVPSVSGYQATYDYSRFPSEDFDPEEYRKYYQSCDVSLLQSRLQILLKEVSILQSLLDQKTTEATVQKKAESPIAPATPLPPTPKTPPPPPHKEYMWRKAVDEDGAKYYYHKETRESVWELPDGEESDPGERTPTRMPDTSGCGNDPESDSVELSKNHDGLLSRWSAICSPQVSTSNTAQGSTPTPVLPVQTNAINGTPKAIEKKRDRDKRVWEKFGSDADRKRAKKLMCEIEKVVGPIIVRHIGHRDDATKKRQDWIIKQVSKEMLKRESERVDFNFTLTGKGAKRVTDYADAFIQRKCAKEPKDLWKGYDGSP
nr:WW Rsp5 WWP domain containing protein [Haemonchus contortus]